MSVGSSSQKLESPFVCLLATILGVLTFAACNSMIPKPSAPAPPPAASKCECGSHSGATGATVGAAK